MKNLPGIKKALAAAQVEALLLTHPPTVRWATGFESSHALVYVDVHGVTMLITDPRYGEAAQKLTSVQKILVAHRESLTAVLKRELSPSVRRIGFQAEHVSAAAAEQMRSTLAPAELVPTLGMLRTQIAVKTAAEITSIAKAQQATDAAFREILSIITPGMTEQAIAAELVYRQLHHGADRIHPDFWPIVASGPNSSLPHAHATDRRIQHGDAILMDFGCMVDGYCSDMTRTVVCGKPSATFRTVYQLVLQAQEASLAIARAGMPASTVDAAYRDPIERAGYDIPHAGHGVGLEIHEWPHIAPRNTEPLPAHSVITIEPGVYLPGEFGIRIEDMVVIEKNGCRNLTASPKELIIL